MDTRGCIVTGYSVSSLNGDEYRGNLVIPSEF
jgi:hypothetical protein